MSNVPLEVTHSDHQHHEAFLVPFVQLTQLTYLQLNGSGGKPVRGPLIALASSVSSLQSLQTLKVLGGRDFPFWIRAVDILPAISALPHLRHLHIPATVWEVEGAERVHGSGCEGGQAPAAVAMAAALKALPSSLESLGVGAGRNRYGIRVTGAVPGLLEALCSHTAFMLLRFEGGPLYALLPLNCVIKRRGSGLTDALPLKGILQALPNLQEVFVNIPTGVPYRSSLPEFPTGVIAE